MKPKIYITPNMMYQINTIILWSTEHRKEVSFLGALEVIDNKPYITKLYLVDQECSAAETNMLSNALEELYKSLTEEERSMIMFWGHTHMNGTTPSGQDEEEFETYKKNCDTFVMAIFSSNSVYIRLSSASSMWKIETEAELCVRHEEICNSILEEIGKHVKEPVKLSRITNFGKDKNEQDWYEHLYGHDAYGNQLPENYPYNNAYKSFPSEGKGRSIAGNEMTDSNDDDMPEEYATPFVDSLNNQIAYKKKAKKHKKGK